MGAENIPGLAETQRFEQILPKTLDAIIAVHNEIGVQAFSETRKQDVLSRISGELPNDDEYEKIISCVQDYIQLAGQDLALHRPMPGFFSDRHMVNGDPRVVLTLAQYADSVFFG